jgi:toxin ParE1/3/4
VAHIVKITLRAERDLVLLYGEINAEYSDATLKWYRALRNAILSMEKGPNRGSIFQKRIRLLLYGHKPHIYRVLYRGREKQEQVEILHIRHCARRSPRISDLHP